MNLSTILKQIGFILVILVASFILVHFLAIFGVFLALAIPILHLMFYPHILCFWCKITGSRHTLRHSIIDSSLTLILTALSLVVVYGEYILLNHGVHPLTPQIASFSIPAKNQYQIGDTITIPIHLEHIPASINIVQADLSFDPKLLQVIDLTTDGTFASFFVQKEYDNTKGYVRLTGGIPNPGYTKPSGLIGTVYFRAISSGAANLQYLDSSLVLANDGRGTNLLSDYPSIPLLILPNSSSATPTPHDLSISTQVEGDADTTVMSFTQYADSLPAPFADVQGISDASASPLNSPAPNTSLTSRLIHLDSLILSAWQKLLPH